MISSQLISFWVLASQHPQEMRIQMTKISNSNQLEIAKKEIKSNLSMHVYVIQYQRFFDFGLIHVLLKVSRGKNESWINVYIYCILWSEGAFVGVTMVFFNNISSRIYWQKVDRKWSGWNLSMNEYRLLTQIHNDSQWRLFRKLQKTIITCSQTLTFRENGLLMKCRAVEYIINRIIE